MRNQVLRDFSSDNGRQLLHKLSLKHDFPSYVLSAPEDEFVTEGNQAKCAQLIPEPRLPTHTKAATWLSYACFVDQRNTLPKEEQSRVADYLDKRAAFWEIDDDISKLVSDHESMTKQAAATDEAYPVRNVEEAKIANEWLTERLAEAVPTINLSDRVLLARKISAWIEPSAAVKETCCDRGCYDGMKLAMKVRSAVGENADPAIEKLCKQAEECSPTELRDTQFEIAKFLEKHASSIERPELFVQVNTTDDVLLLANGAVVRTKDASQVKSTAVEVASLENMKLGFDRAMEAELASKLSVSLADLFCDELREAGVRFEVKPPVEDIRMLGV